MMEYGRVINAAIVGGGSGCKAIMDMIFAEKLRQLRMRLIGVACTNPEAVGYRYAQEQGIYVTRDYHNLYQLKDLNMIIEVTGREEVANEIARSKPDHVRLMGNVAARLFWDIFRIEEERIADRRQVAEALLESKIILNSILFSSPIAIGVAENRVFIWANKAMLDMFGFEDEEDYKGQSTRIIYASEEEFERVAQRIYNEAKESRAAGADAKFRRNDGSVFYGHIRINYPDPSNPMKRNIYTISDISWRKEAEEALRQSEEEARNTGMELALGLSEVFEALKDISSGDPSVRIPEASDLELIAKLKHMVNLTAENLAEIVNLSHEFAIGLAEHFDVLHRVSKGELKARVSGTSQVDLLESLKKVTNDMVRSVSRAIAEHEQAEEALRQSENKYRTLLENLPQKIFYKDRNSVYVSCNENFARDLKIKPEDITAKTDYEFFPKELAEKYRADDKRIIASGKTQDVEEKYLQDGQEVWVHTVKTPIKDKKGYIRGILGIFWDVTARKRAEDVLQRAYEELEIRVEERTAELSRANVLLKQEIAERKEVEEALRSERDKFGGILASLGEGVSIINHNFSIEYQNDVLKKKFGDGVGEKCFAHYKASNEPCQPCPIHKAIESGEMQRIEIVLSDGRHYEQSCSRFTDVDGEVKTVLLSRHVKK